MDEIAGRPPTLQDVAEVLGMHKSTVSLALSGKGNVSAATRARVAKAARELGYAPNPLAQRLARGFHNDSVCLFAGTLDVGLATHKVLSIQAQLHARSLDVPIYSCGGLTGEDNSVQLTQIRQLRRQRPRAILCASQRVEAAVFAELDAYQREGGILVSYDTPVPLECDRVIFDREDNAYRAARHLLERGHRKIGIGMANTPEPEGSYRFDPVHDRLDGFCRALKEFGVSPREEWFLFRSAGYEPGGAEMARQFLRLRERPTALCIVNDYVALAFMVEVMRAGVRVPQDLSLVSHDDQPIAAYCPVPLTTMLHPADRIAATVVELLLDRIEGRVGPEAPPRVVRITGCLVERDSVAEPGLR